MITLKSIYIVISLILVSLSIDARINSTQYKINSHKSYSYESCKEYEDDQRDYYLGCHQGVLKTELSLDKLDRDTKKISRFLYGNYILNDLKDFVLKHLEAKRKEADEINKCIENLKDDNCLRLISDLFYNTWAELIDLRKFMSLKDRSLPVSKFSVMQDERPYRVMIQHNVVPFYQNNVPRLSKDETTEIQEIYNSNKAQLYQTWMHENFNNYPFCIRSESREGRRQYFLNRDKRCKSIASKRSREVSGAPSKRLREEYEKKYLNLLERNPLLIHFDITGREPGEEVFEKFKEALIKIRENIDRSIMSLKSSSPLDLGDLTKNDLIVNKFLSDEGISRHKCDVLQSIKNKEDNIEIAQDIGLGVGLVASGIFCGMTGGFVCGLGAAIGGEAVGFSIAKNRYDTSRIAFESNLRSVNDLKSRTTDITISSVLAPTAVLGLDGAIKITRESLDVIKYNPIEDISVLTPRKAKELFNEMKNQKHIPFCEVRDGCYVRAHEMARLLEERGVITKKAFIEGRLIVETPHTPSGVVMWNYHVAPVVNVRVNGREELYVFDPSIFDKPVPIEEWHNIQVKNKMAIKGETYLKNRFYYTTADKYKDLMDYHPAHLEHTRETLMKYAQSLKQKGK